MESPLRPWEFGGGGSYDSETPRLSQTLVARRTFFEKNLEVVVRKVNQPIRRHGYRDKIGIKKSGDSIPYYGRIPESLLILCFHRCKDGESLQAETVNWREW